jgi:hypothetical protein
MEPSGKYQAAVDKFIEALQELTQLKKLPWSEGPDTALDLSMFIAPFYSTVEKRQRYTLIVMTDVENKHGAVTLLSHEDDAPSDTRIQQLSETAIRIAKERV